MQALVLQEYVAVTEQAPTPGPTARVPAAGATRLAREALIRCDIAWRGAGVLSGTEIVEIKIVL